MLKNCQARRVGALEVHDVGLVGPGGASGSMWEKWESAGRTQQNGRPHLTAIDSNWPARLHGGVAPKLLRSMIFFCCPMACTSLTCTCFMVSDSFKHVLEPFNIVAQGRVQFDLLTNSSHSIDFCSSHTHPPKPLVPPNPPN